MLYLIVDLYSDITVGSVIVHRGDASLELEGVHIPHATLPVLDSLKQKGYGFKRVPIQ